MKIIDVNAAFGFWPIQRIPFTDLAALDAVYERLGIGEVWLSAVESILYPEPATFDQALFARMEAFPRFRPVLTVNPLMANWEAELRDAQREHPLAAIRLFPSYHGCAPDHPEAVRLAAVAGELGLPMLVQMRVNDERNQPVCMQVAGAKATAIAALSLAVPETTIIALSSYYGELADLAKGSHRLLAELSFLDGASPILWAQEAFPAERLVFGSLAPWLYPDAALMKLRHHDNPPSLQEGVASGHLLCALHGRAVEN